jgi:hypothetical protein
LFPIEVHTRLPLVHWLPEGPAGRAYDLAGKSWARANRLLGPSALRSLFPGPVEIRNLGLTLTWRSRERVSPVSRCSSSSSGSCCTTSRWHCSGRRASVTPRSTQCPPGRTSCCSRRRARARRQVDPQLFWADRLALAYGGLVVVYAVAPQSWLGGDATGRGGSTRCATTSAARRVRPRTTRRARPFWWRRIGLTLIGIGVGLAAWGARRRVPRPVRLVARLRCPRLVLRAARARLPVPLGAPRELDSQHG